MHRKVGLACVLGILTLNCQAFGWGLPSIPTMSQSDDGAKTDVKALTGREAVLKLRMNTATVTLANGLIEIQKACGKVSEAAKLEAALAEAKKNPSDIEGTKMLCTEVNNASDAMKKIDMNASMNKGEARKRLGKSLLYLGAGSLVDVLACNDAKNLAKDITSGVSAVKAAPMSYGLSAVSDLTSGLSTAKFIAETAPGQIVTITELTKGLVKYAQTNKIEIPSQKEQEKQAQALEKE